MTDDGGTDDDSDSDSHSDEGGGMMDGQSSEYAARDLIESFLDLKDNMTHLLMSYISRMPQGPKISQEDLDVDLSAVIGPTLPLFSEAPEEVRATQLSYSEQRALGRAPGRGRDGQVVFAAQEPVDLPARAGRVPPAVARQRVPRARGARDPAQPLAQVVHGGAGQLAAHPVAAQVRSSATSTRSSWT